MFIVFAQNDYWPRKVGALAVDFITDVDAEVHLPDFTFAKIEGLDVGIENFLLFVPTIEVFSMIAVLVTVVVAGGHTVLRMRGV